MTAQETQQQAVALFREHGNVLRTSEAMRIGIHPRTLYALRDDGVLDRLSRGLYRLADAPPLSNPDLATVALKVSRAVVCLVSALAFHELTTQVPHVVDIALPRGAEQPRLKYPPLRVYRFSGRAWSEGVETYTVDDVPVRAYGPEMSVADIFMFRRKIGLDVALEALKLYLQRERADVSILLHYARVCRVESVMKPYLEALV